MPSATILIVEASSEIQEGKWSWKFYKYIARVFRMPRMELSPKRVKKNVSEDDVWITVYMGPRISQNSVSHMVVAMAHVESILNM